MNVSKNALVAIGAGVAVVTGVAAAALGAFTDSSQPVPTRADAQALLSSVWKRAADRDGAAVCRYAAARANCRVQLGNADGVWPTKEPSITCDRDLAADAEFSGGYALRVEGVDSDGEPYTTDILAIGTKDGPRLMNPVFWKSANIGDGHDTSAKVDVCA